MSSVNDCWLEAETAVGFRTFYSLHLRPLKTLKVIHGPAAPLLDQISHHFTAQGRAQWRWHSVYAPEQLTGLVVPDLGAGWIAATTARQIELPHTLMITPIQENREAPPDPTLDQLRARIKRCLSGASAALAEYDLLMPPHQAGDNLVRQWVHEYLLPWRPPSQPGPHDWHGFGTPLTSQGPDAHLLSREFDRLSATVHLEGGSSLTHTRLVRRFGEQALMGGLTVRFYHDALDPSRIDHLIIPELNLGVTNDTAPHQMTGGRHVQRIWVQSPPSARTLETTEYWWGVFQKFYTQAWRLMEDAAELVRRTAGEVHDGDLSRLMALCTA